jgi:hypothetical protein
VPLMPHREDAIVVPRIAKNNADTVLVSVASRSPEGNIPQRLCRPAHARCGRALPFPSLLP